MQPPEGSPVTDKKLCTWGMICHLSGLSQYLGIALGHIVVPLVIWLLKKHDHPFLDAVGKEVLNFQISLTLYILLAIGASVIIRNPFPVLIVAVLGIALVIRAATRAYRGQHYAYPGRIRFLK